MDLAEFAARCAPLRALDASHGRAARAKLRSDHGEYLARFAVQALGALPRDLAAAAESDEREALLCCAHEAARHVLWLGAFKSPEPEKLCYNVAARCLADCIITRRISVEDWCGHAV